MTRRELAERAFKATAELCVWLSAWREAQAFAPTPLPAGQVHALTDIRGWLTDLADILQEHTTTDGIGLVLDETRPDQVLLHGVAVPLRPAEFTLLRALAREPGRAVSAARLRHGCLKGDALWDSFYTTVRRLRAAFEKSAPGTGAYIRTLAKHGVLLDLAPSQVEIRTQNLN